MSSRGLGTDTERERERESKKSVLSVHLDNDVCNFQLNLVNLHY